MRAKLYNPSNNPVIKTKEGQFIDIRALKKTGERKQRIDEYLYIDIRKINKANLLNTDKKFMAVWSYMGVKKASMVMWFDGENLNFRYMDKDIVSGKVKLDYTECNYGGIRYWFKCPVCNKRFTKLIFNSYDSIYLCRNCFGIKGLSYTTCHLSKSDYHSRINIKLNYLMDKLKIENDYGIENKPDLMSWKTFFKMEVETKMFKIALAQRPKGMHKKTFMKLKRELRKFSFLVGEFFREQDEGKYIKNSILEWRDTTRFYEGIKFNVEQLP